MKTLLVATFAALLAQAQTFTVLHTFTGADGAQPYGTPIMLNGTLYGTAKGGGAYGDGVVYTYANGTFATLYQFGAHPSDVAHPVGGLLAVGAYLYGASNGIYKLDLSGNEWVLRWLPLQCFGSLALNAGTLYGVTDTVTNHSGHGKLFSLGKGGLKETIWGTPGNAWGTPAVYDGHIYATVTDAITRDGTTVIAGIPVTSYSGLMSDGNGTLYGMAGGPRRNPNGIVFAFDVATASTRILHQFTGADGSHPCYATLALDGAGNLYGTTPIGGAYNAGVVFEITTAGEYVLLYSFTGGADGGNPYAGVVGDGSGNIYGVATTGGAGYGTLFEVTP